MGVKIGLLYLDATNLGDVVIYETARYIIEDILKKENISGYELVPISIESYNPRKPGDSKVSLKARIKKVLTALIKKAADNGFLTKHFGDFMEKVLIKSWHHTNTYKAYVKNERIKLKGLNYIIVSGGGLIKYHRQNFHFFMDDVLRYADEKNIPVLINAQGIEGYSDSNSECQLLKKAINRNCVKYISTRDDYAMLRNCYVVNPDIVVKGVCDPAFWLEETYGIKKHTDDAKKIGLNVIRPDIFGEYMYNITEERLGKLYYDIARRLYAKGYKVELFSNGVAEDTEFIYRFFENYPDAKTKYNVTFAEPKSTKELIDTIAGYERYMAVRLHSAIIGTVLEIPNISLVWNRKQLLFGREIGLLANFLTKEKFKSGIIVDTLLDAKPYEMDQAYKMSVYENLREQIHEWIACRKGNKIAKTKKV